MVKEENFENKMKQLEEIVNVLEKGELSFEMYKTYGKIFESRSTMAA